MLIMRHALIEDILRRYLQVFLIVFRSLHKTVGNQKQEFFLNSIFEKLSKFYTSAFSTNIYIYI